MSRQKINLVLGGRGGERCAVQLLCRAVPLACLWGSVQVEPLPAVSS